MIYVVCLVATYLVIGLCLSIWVSYQDWREGEDYLIGDLWFSFLRVLTWPMMAWVLLEDSEIWSKVLIPGRQSAKFYRALRSESSVDRQG